MEGIIAGRTAGDMPGLDLAEQRAWEHYLDSAMRLYAALNHGLTDTHDLTLVDVRLLELLDRSPTGRPADGGFGRPAIGAAQPGDPADSAGWRGWGWWCVPPAWKNGRGVLAGITAEGRDTIAKALATYSKDVREHFISQLSRPQLAAMGENCRRITAALRASGAPDKFSHG
ncbi:MAG: hypothetical protein QM805_04260 [Pseudomonas sp.]